MELKIVRPTSSQSFAVNWVEAQTDEGNVIILPGHTPLIIVLASEKELSLELEDGTQKQIAIGGGILTVTRTELTLLVTHEQH